MAPRRVASGAPPARKKKRKKPPVPSPWPGATRDRLVAALCQKMSDEGFSMKHALLALDLKSLRLKAVPAPSTFLSWMYPGAPKAALYQAMYDAARLARADHYEDETVVIADNAVAHYIDKEGNPRVDPGAIAYANARINSRQWLVERMRPKKQLVAVDHTTQGRPLQGAVVALPAWVPIGSAVDGSG